MLKAQQKSVNHFICELQGVQVWLKREDLLHSLVSGNKFRKLKYNLQAAKDENHSKVLTFGGAFSNHILATAAAAQEENLQSIGIIRGDELGGKNLENTLAHNPTLRQAKQMGMQFHFVSRSDYRKKHELNFINALRGIFSDFYLIPEGGTNNLAIKGCEEILTEEDKNFDVVSVAVGTGGTISGLINSASVKQKIMGFPALKGNFLQDEISKNVKKENWQLILNYHFGGYAKTNEALIAFINAFKEKYCVTLDPIYTGKMMYGLFDLIKNDYFKENTRILAIHTGGLQGIAGMNKNLRKKGKTCLL
ncbi:1-aminocyclopropane-1-carboxylate deaminase/D-cysteine desulfhydrase [Haloflavibacter putidus]|uniref:1-aminocyclopropane-1-carboxylate deaminase/D-cysteine desulfhydrase n=1 Tax=Haloflavibacter putidus TaxID=2576776 RepID=A0A507ZVP9_9FLAO|nr:pyridoxal-phosphate dependent enzyme [Haloflavibacter putidus]TQD39768.1 1-aminocyclopropane-1-carboxylate deaminase/D-cysteine desulfhydrase [Haloflavibacter putidus]